MHPDLQRHLEAHFRRAVVQERLCTIYALGRAARDAPEGSLRLSQPSRGSARRRGGICARALRGDARRTATSSRSSSPAPAPRSRPPASHHGARPSAAVNRDPNQYFFYTERSHFDWLQHDVARQVALHAPLPRLPAGAPARRRPLPAHALPRLRHDPRRSADVLPDAPIVYTLHEFLPICHRNGQMVRTGRDELCLEASPRRCHECFPEITPQTFFLRKRFIQSHLRSSTCSSRPSHFLLRAVRRLGHPAREDPLRGVRPPAAAGAAARAARRAAAQPARLLRPVQLPSRASTSSC